jgi:hypothetical protein
MAAVKDGCSSNPLIYLVMVARSALALVWHVSCIKKEQTGGNNKSSAVKID